MPIIRPNVLLKSRLGATTFVQITSKCSLQSPDKVIVILSIFFSMQDYLFLSLFHSSQSTILQSSEAKFTGSFTFLFLRTEENSLLRIDRINDGRSSRNF